MCAFIPALQMGSFVPRPSQLSRPQSRTLTSPRMAYDENGPVVSKYLSKIPVDRLNKAPLITINSFGDPSINSVSVGMVDLYADQGAGDSLKAGIMFDDEAPPDQSKWAKYYSPETVNEAPVINLYGGATLDFKKHFMSIVQTQVPTQIQEARAFLGDVPPDPNLYQYRYQGRLNMAPNVTIRYGGSDENSVVSVETLTEPLNMIAAAEILSKYGN